MDHIDQMVFPKFPILTGLSFYKSWFDTSLESPLFLKSLFFAVTYQVLAPLPLPT